ncbi:MAG: lipid-A-disaccharide synthase N-terminal domain-containing protein [Verrucomicrobiae bacterium]|nr:lipid-A-disaccharide synthase N-terminal domain-containing protein [Verrucomicrobiae bacterium]MCP5520322.1 lipid-A-disaccharide synthase N-terminal domain-containing protein [Verrucomicrobiales bacterium]
MDTLWHWLWQEGRFLGIEWHFWKAVGWLGNAVFFSRFLVQWYATERQRRVVIPVAFWWLSLTGAMLLFSYALFYRRDSVFIFAYAFTWIPYLRNLIIHRRTVARACKCPDCGGEVPDQANYCPTCGLRLVLPPGEPVAA